MSTKESSFIPIGTTFHGRMVYIQATENERQDRGVAGKLSALVELLEELHREVPNR